MKTALITGLALVGALALTTLAIDAADTLSGKGGTLLARVLQTESAVCPLGMTHFPAGRSFTCVDTYEAAAGPGCSIENPENQFQTEANSIQKACQAVSETTLLPWRYVSREQARVLCTKAGKRLPSASEWYEFAMGTNVEACVVDAPGPAVGQDQAGCVSAGGVVGAVGNVWEWVSDDVADGHLSGNPLPPSGRIVSVDEAGVANVTTESLETAVLPGYFWAEADGNFGIIRGGFYGSRRDASVYTLHAHTPTQFVGAGVGFRCVR